MRIAGTPREHVGALPTWGSMIGVTPFDRSALDTGTGNYEYVLKKAVSRGTRHAVSAVPPDDYGLYLVKD